MTEEINEALDSLTSRLEVIFSLGKSLKPDEYFELMSSMEYLKIKYFSSRHQTHQTFSDFIKGLKS